MRRSWSDAHLKRLASRLSVDGQCAAMRPSDVPATRSEPMVISNKKQGVIATRTQCEGRRCMTLNLPILAIRSEQALLVRGREKRSFDR